MSISSICSPSRKAKAEEKAEAQRERVAFDTAEDFAKAYLRDGEEIIARNLDGAPSKLVDDPDGLSVPRKSKGLGAVTTNQGRRFRRFADGRCVIDAGLRSPILEMELQPDGSLKEIR